MKTAFLYVIIIFYNLLAFAGPGDGGGAGSVVQCQSMPYPILLDRITLNEELATNSHLYPFYEINQKTSEDENMEFVNLNDSDLEIRKMAIQKISDWEIKMLPSNLYSWSILNLLKNRIKKMSFTKTRFTFKLVDSYHLPSNIKANCHSIFTAILFLPSIGPIISIPIWNSLNFNTKIGLIIHEGLREIQLLGHFNYPLRNLELQSIVAQIMDSEPSPDKNFDKWITGLHPILNPYIVMNCPISNSQICTKYQSFLLPEIYTLGIIKEIIFRTDEHQKELRKKLMSNSIVRKRFIESELAKWILK